MSYLDDRVMLAVRQCVADDIHLDLLPRSQHTKGWLKRQVSQLCWQGLLGQCSLPPAVTAIPSIVACNRASSQ